jgi:spermidine synthase
MPSKRQLHSLPKDKSIKSSLKNDILTMWKANTIVFVSSFCVMVIELVAGRILAPYLGVSLYTWTTIIGVVLAGIALGNFVGGKIADRSHSPLILVAIFFVGGLFTIAIPQFTWTVGHAGWAKDMPIMLNFTLRTACVFLLPAFVLSMVSPLVIKLSLADLGRTGGVVGTIYAISTVGSILGTFTTGFVFIMLFGIRTLVWLVGGVLILTGIFSLFVWKMPNRWKFSFRNISIWLACLVLVLIYIPSRNPGADENRWNTVTYQKESNYYTINVRPLWNTENVKVLTLDHLIHSYVDPANPLYLEYDYLKIFVDIVKYVSQGNEAPKMLHLGGGGYSFPRYMEAVYPRSLNEVVEIDPLVTQVAQKEFGLSAKTRIITHNLDARLFLTDRTSAVKYDFVIGDVFNDASTPYHLTTLEFDRMVKATMQKNGVYLINTIDDFQQGKYLASLIRTLEQVFDHVYVWGASPDWENARFGTFVLAATDLNIDTAELAKFASSGGKKPSGYVYDEGKLENHVGALGPVLFTDDYAPTDNLLAPLAVMRSRE